MCRVNKPFFFFSAPRPLVLVLDLALALGIFLVVVLVTLEEDLNLVAELVEACVAVVLAMVGEGRARETSRRRRYLGGSDSDQVSASRRK